MNKRIWIFNHYASDMYTNEGGRHYWFAKNLMKKGFTPVIFCANTFHNSKNEIFMGKNDYLIKELNGITFVFLKTTQYKSNGISRIRNMFSYYKNLMKLTKKFETSFGKPDVIYASSVHPLTLVAGIKISKKMKIANISEIRDLWPEAIFKFSKLKENSILGKVLIRGEKWIYEQSNALIFTKEGDIDYILDRGWLVESGGKVDRKKCYYINNGVDIEDFNNKVNGSKLYDEDLLSEKFKIIYTGSIRPVNNLKKIIKVAQQLKNEEEILFLIYGNGSELEQLNTLAKENKLNNIIFKGRIDKKYIPFIMSNANLALLNYSQKNYNWTRGNSSNKLFEYFAAGKPVLSTVKMGYSPIKKYNCGVEIEGDENELEIASEILKIKYLFDNDKVQYDKLCLNSLNASKEFDISFLTDKLIDVINEVRESE